MLQAVLDNLIWFIATAIQSHDIRAKLSASW